MAKKIDIGKENHILIVKGAPGKKIRNSKRNQKQSNFPKAMTIRYDEKEEADIIKMQEKMGEKTMSKAFLKAPLVIKNMKSKIDELELMVNEQKTKMDELTMIVDSFNEFNVRLEKFVNR